MNAYRILFFQSALCLISAFFASESPSQENWADPKLPVVNGLEVWLDASRQIDAWAAENRHGGQVGAKLDTLYDGSGKKHHFFQDFQDSQPLLADGGGSLVVRFDGKDDFLRASLTKGNLTSATLFLVFSYDSNSGFFRSVFSGAKHGTNDYVTGINIDQGPLASNQFEVVNPEGAGFGGAQDLLIATSPFGKYHILEISVGEFRKQLQVRLDGVPQGTRSRGDKEMILDRIYLGCRYYSNSADPPFVSGFMHGAVSEFLVFDRELAEDESLKVRDYLREKHTSLLSGVANRSQGYLLTPLEKTPLIQMLVPGFEAVEVPVDLTNVNNVRYREDGKLLALGYNGNVFLLEDTDGDGLEDKSSLYFENKGNLRGPIGMAIAPTNYRFGKGIIVASKGKVSFLHDQDGDDRVDEEKVIATGWEEITQNVDAIGVAFDKDHSIYFGLGTANYANGFLLDNEGNSHFDLESVRGTIQRISPDWSKRETVCTGVRFPVALDFHSDGSLFATDQEGATWLSNGNPFDELLVIEPNRHFGFPPRHPKHLPGVINEPSVFDYRPQHQSTCGLFFNRSINGGPVFGPNWWEGDALVCGESRGKLYRTQVVRTKTGYVAKNQLLACLSMLTVDACVSPQGDLVVACHSGPPDWGTGPEGKGKLFKLRYSPKITPQLAASWVANSKEIVLAFDQPLDPETLRSIRDQIELEGGIYVQPGDRFEVLKPPYAVVQKQTATPRYRMPIHSLTLEADNRNLRISTEDLKLDWTYSVSLPNFAPTQSIHATIEQVPTLDFGVEPFGVLAKWTSADGKETAEVVLPHPDLAVSKAMTRGSAFHDRFFDLLPEAGRLELDFRLATQHYFEPEVQIGSKLDYEPEVETLGLSISGKGLTSVMLDGQSVSISNGKALATLTEQNANYAEMKIVLTTGPQVELTLNHVHHADKIERPFSIRRFATPFLKESDAVPESEAELYEKELAAIGSGKWLRGRELFFSAQLQCSKCHSLRGMTDSKIGPDLSNLVHRDRNSILRDIRLPSAGLNPDFITLDFNLKDGQILSGIPLQAHATHVVLGTSKGERIEFLKSEIDSFAPSRVSTMPEKLLESLSDSDVEALLAFLMHDPLQPTTLVRGDAPRLRSFKELTALASAEALTQNFDVGSPTKIVLCTGPKDHGPDEHDYPLFRERWKKLLGLSRNVSVDIAEEWPTEAQFKESNLIVFYSANAGWNLERAKQLDEYLLAGGGAVFMHWAVNGHSEPEALAQRIGLAADGNQLKFRHGELELHFAKNASPILAGFDKLELVDESYWQMIGMSPHMNVLATAVEDGKEQPLIWTVERGKGRVFVSIMGHYSWTFDDPAYRVLLLRGMMWAAQREPDALAGLATPGARIDYVTAPPKAE